MFRFLKLLMLLLIVLVVAVLAYAYIGDLSPTQTDVSTPVDLDGS